MLELTGTGLAPVHSPAPHRAASAKPLVRGVGVSAAGHCGGSWVTQISLTHSLRCNQSSFSPLEFLEFSKETVFQEKLGPYQAPKSTQRVEEGKILHINSCHPFSLLE